MVGVTLLLMALRIAAAVEDSSVAAAKSDLTPEQIASRIYSPFTRQAKRIGRAARQRAHEWQMHHAQHHHKANALRGARSTLAVHTAAPSTTIAPAIEVVNTKIAAAATTSTAAAPIQSVTVTVPAKEPKPVVEVTKAASAAVPTSATVRVTTAAPHEVATTAAAKKVATTTAQPPAALNARKDADIADDDDSDGDDSVPSATTVQPQATAVTSSLAVTTASVQSAVKVDESAADDSDDSDDDSDDDMDDSDELSGSAELVAPVTAFHSAQQAVAASATVKAGLKEPACQCEASNTAWKKTTRTTPECVFIDLGAANGNTFQYFVNNGYGAVSNCPNGKYQAVLVEANPRFNADLANIASQYQGLVDSRAGTAAYMCEAQTSFFVDTVNTQNNYWGSSMSPNHPDAQKSGLQQVVVNTMNLNRYLYENTIPGDWVMVKMDIEGAEWEVIPCLAQSPAASLIDRMYLEEHPQSWTQGSATQEQMTEAKLKLQSMGVDIPAYFSHTL